jgi:hypothetical protein
LKHAAKHITWILIGLLASVSSWAQMLPVKSDRLWGLIEPSGKQVVAAQYDAVNVINNRRAVIVQNGKYGLIDSLGKVLIDPQYTYLRCDDDTLILINQGGDCQNENCEGGKWGLINLSNQRKLEPKYNLIQSFSNIGLALVNQGGKCGYDTCSGGKWGIIASDGTEVLAPDYLKVVVVNRREAFVQGEAGWGLFDIQRKRFKIEPKYEELSRINPRRIAMRAGKLWGLLSDEGDTIAPAKYGGLSDAGQYYLAWKMVLKYGLMDSMGREITPPRYDKLMMDDFSWLRFERENRLGLGDTTDREIVGPNLRRIEYCGDGFAIVAREEGYGVVNRLGQEIVPVKYESCEIVNDTLFLVHHKKSLRWYDLKGNKRYAVSYDSLSAFTKNNVAKIKVAGSWGLINREGNYIIPPKYEDVRVYFQASKAKRGDKVDFFYFDEKGHSSIVKRIVVIKGEEEESDRDLLAVNGNAFLGWFSNQLGFWGLRDPRSNRILIEPCYQAVEVVPGTNVTFVKGKIKGTENWAWGMVNHMTGKVLCEYLFETVIGRDFLTQGLARVVYLSSSKYALIDLNGRITNLGSAGYIGPFAEGVARVNIGGNLVWGHQPGMDTIQSQTSLAPYTNEIVVKYSYCEGGKWGYIDSRGSWLRPAEYEGALEFEGDLARVKIKGKWGAVNRSFQIVVAPRYDFIQRLCKIDDRTYFTVGQDQIAYGFIDEKGEIAIKASFEEVGQFHGGFVRIRQGKLWGYANRQGDVVVPAQYVDAGDFYEGRARVRNARAWGYIDTLGNNITPQKYLRAGDFSEGLAWIQGEKFFGYVNLEGELAIAPAFSAAGDFSEGLAPVKRKGVYGMIDRQGRWVLQPQFYRIGKFQDSLAVVQEMGSFGLVNPRGEFVIKPIYKEISDFHEGLAKFRNGMEYGYLNPKGLTSIPSSYSNAGDFSCGRAAFFYRGKWGFIDTAGVEIIPAIYSKVMDFHEDRAAVRLGDLWGFIDLNGEIAVPIIYTKVADFQDGRAAVNYNGRTWGLVNYDGTIVVPAEYADIGFRHNKVVSVLKNRKWGLINTFGAQMTPCKYDEIGQFAEGMAAVMQRRSVGVVDDQGKVLLDPHFDTILRMDAVLQVEDEDALGYIDFKGTWIWSPSK